MEIITLLRWSFCPKLVTLLSLRPGQRSKKVNLLTASSLQVIGTWLLNSKCGFRLEAFTEKYLALEII
jgi:hypothetical protein